MLRQPRDILALITVVSGPKILVTPSSASIRVSCLRHLVNRSLVANSRDGLLASKSVENDAVHTRATNIFANIALWVSVTSG